MIHDALVGEMKQIEGEPLGHPATDHGRFVRAVDKLGDAAAPPLGRVSLTTEYYENYIDNLT